ncbi:MAG: hypothetical protein LQ340_006103 [Diploschistes diacapsis]|nr:MAG: hypothetical protein LQ340_006103 [Diploschistes diacapsis]
MPTPLRVRGKRGNKRRVVESKDTRMFQAVVVGAANVSPKPRLSSLEQLPAETLQEIFFLSANLGLPLVSSALYAKLNSEYVKKRFVISYFAREEVTNQAMDAGYALSYVENQNFVAGFQSQLAGLNWFTASLLKSCREEFLWQQVVKAVSHFERKHGTLQRKDTNLAEIKRVLFCTHSKSNVGADKDPTYETLDTTWSFYTSLEADRRSLVIELRFNGRFRLGSMEEVEIRMSPGQDAASGVLPPNELYRPYKPCIPPRLHMPLVSRDFVVPDRLLRGPWTDDKVTLLAWISRDVSEKYGGCRKELPFDHAVAAQGLMDAIQAYCSPAVALLAQPRRCDLLAGFMRRLRASQSQQLDRPLELDTKFGYWENTRCYHPMSYCQHISFGVFVQEKHLIAALETAEKLGDSEATLFRWLLPLCLLQQPYWDARKNRDLSVFVEWAIRKKVEEKRGGIIDGLGAMALRLLDEEQRRNEF